VQQRTVTPNTVHKTTKLHERIKEHLEFRCTDITVLPVNPERVQISQGVNVSYSSKQ